MSFFNNNIFFRDFEDEFMAEDRGNWEYTKAKQRNPLQSFFWGGYFFFIAKEKWSFDIEKRVLVQTDYWLHANVHLANNTAVDWVSLINWCLIVLSGWDNNWWCWLHIERLVFLIEKAEGLRFGFVEWSSYRVWSGCEWRW